MSRPPLKVMISSRVTDMVPFDGDVRVSMATLRAQVKSAIEDVRAGDEPMFDVWINEDEPAAAGDETSWEHCMDQARSADIVLSLFNGNAGWAKQGGDIGICHAELETALGAGRGRVRLLKLPDCASGASGDQAVRNRRFAEYVDQQNLFRDAADRADEVTGMALRTLRDAVLDLARRGKVSARADRYDRGAALLWSRLSFADRKAALERVLAQAVGQRSGARELDASTFLVPLHGQQLVVRVAGIPAGMGVAAAREMVGRPHLADHALQPHVHGADGLGPVHIIACHRGVTETQALNVLGFPDAVVVASGFGVYVADNAQKAQLVFLRECRDETRVRHAAQLFFDWVEHSGEGLEIVARAGGRREIVEVVARLHTPRP